MDSSIIIFYEIGQFNHPLNRIIILFRCKDMEMQTYDSIKTQYDSITTQLFLEYSNAEYSAWAASP